MNVIAQLAVARRGLIPTLIVFIAALAAFYGAGVQQHLANGGFQDPSSESMRVDDALARDFGTGVPNLFVISRFRDELAAGADVGQAVRTTIRTAGMTVVFSGVTVALSLSALLVFPMYFFRSIAYGGIAVVLVAALTSVVALPALLAVLGHRVNRFDVFGRFRRRTESGFWQRLALAVMRRPIPIVTVIVGLLLVLGSPFLSASFSLADDRVLPAASPARQAAQFLRDNFDVGEINPIPVVMPGVAGADALRMLPPYAARLSALPGVRRVDTLTGSYADGRLVASPTPASGRFTAKAGSRLSVVSSVEPYSPEGRALVAAVRTADGARVPGQVGGQAAQLVDTTDATGGKLPLALLIIAVMTFVLLFLFTGSLLIPVKAIVLNLLSLTATFGSMVYIFQDGHLKWLVGDFTTTGMIDATMPVLMFCIAFGLSMDYEVFLLSRIREEYLRSGDNTHSVALGLEKTGRVMSAGAVLIGAVFITFASSGLTLLKLLGVGLALAVIVDATLVRGLLVPAFMRLAGRANWWAPPLLRRLHDRFGLSEYTDPLPDEFSGLVESAERREMSNPRI